MEDADLPVPSGWPNAERRALREVHVLAAYESEAEPCLMSPPCEAFGRLVGTARPAYPWS